MKGALADVHRKIARNAKPRRGCRCHEEIDGHVADPQSSSRWFASSNPWLSPQSRHLAQRGDQLKLPIVLRGAPVRVIVQTHKEGFPDRRASSVLVASFCPFCGKAYDE